MSRRPRCAFRWWSAGELEETEDDLVPRRLAALLRDLLVDGTPDRPLDIGV